MVSDAVLMKQAKRLLRLPFAPSEQEDQKGLLDEFRRVLRPRVLTEAHCAAVVDHLIAHSQRCPPPVEVIEAVETVDAPDVAKAPMGCADCRGSGFRSFSKRVKVGAHQYEAEFADFCGCSLGEFKRAAEARRKAEEAAKAAR